MQTTNKSPFSYGKTNLALLRDSWGGSYFQRAGSRALCGDGKIRSLAYVAPQADTYYSVPAAVRVAGKYVRGYVCTEENRNGDRVVAFRRLHEFAEWLPGWPDKYTPEHETLIGRAAK